MGYDPRQANHYALNADAIKDKETGELIPDSQGVIAHIRQTESTNKYTSPVYAIQGDQKQGHIRVAEIAKGKKQLMNNSNINFEEPIGLSLIHI